MKYLSMYVGYCSVCPWFRKPDISLCLDRYCTLGHRRIGKFSFEKMPNGDDMFILASGEAVSSKLVTIPDWCPLEDKKCTSL